MDNPHHLALRKLAIRTNVSAQFAALLLGCLASPSRPAASGRGCVKTFFSATGTQKRIENRASTASHSRLCSNQIRLF
jgi:hypothetical protein